MFLINGYQPSLAVSDRATQFGDGCFTTARVIDGKVSLLSAHIQRLQDAQRLMIFCDFWPQLEQEMKTLAAEQQNGVLKVVISRGSGGRGYSTLNSGPATRILSVTVYPAHYDRLRNEGMTLALSPVRLGRNPHLAGIKHLNRLEQVLIRSHLEQTNADEALVLDSEGWVTECCAANLFWRKGNVVYTPRLDQAGVNGIMRQFCIRLLAQSSYQLVEVQASLEEALQADEMVICNALMPVMPVRACGDVSFSSATLYEYLAPLVSARISSKKVLLIILLLLVVLGIAAGVGVWKVRHLADSKLLIKEETIFTLKPGTGRLALGEQLYADKIINRPRVFQWLLRIEPDLSHFKAGTYRFTPQMTVREMLKLLESGKEAQFPLRLVEGMRLSDYLKQLREAPYIKHTLSDDKYATVAQALQLENPEWIEGWFWPDTWMYTANTTDVAFSSAQENGESGR